jgi:hypothetical protein
VSFILCLLLFAELLTAATAEAAAELEFAGVGAPSGAGSGAPSSAGTGELSIILYWWL